MQRRDFVAAAALAGLAPAWAQAGYPARPVRMVVPFPPGGPTDVMGRTAAKALGERLGQPCVVENKAGAGGNIGTDAVAKAAPDGYTIGLSAISSLAIAPHLYRNVPFSVERDFAPVSLVGTTPCALVVHPGAPFTDLAGLVAYAKAHPGQLSYATSGVGTSNHLAAELLQSAAGIRLTSVPYKGSSQIVPDLLAGTVPMSMESSLATTLQHVKAGKLRAIAVTSPQRAKALPHVPTVAESGYPGFEVETWFGLVAPSATPPAIVAWLAEAWAAGAKASEVQSAFDAISGNLRTTTPAQFATFIRAESQRWGELIRRLGLQAD
ncbi:Bug family tripartite tricarboxylate transporter substrate binding protein [Paenacidovorax monticola]|uniref:Tripartite tricarboxylate transporter substrate binding protein n=1 Tax=Paenacidovorax monticola TaxID=1926868 RepID=A0A7H0HCE9_9BURK|nr:tripartite tricarboxylate transporter substrate binding protein [Paenacidovorax monticola]QNP58215.1 tripartite tricarboxylate transporter substrate binding protein [Paenacidovorax monticola]